MSSYRKRLHDSAKDQTSLPRIEASEARAEFSTLLNRVAFGGDQVILRRHGKDLAAIIPIEDLKFYDELEDAMLAQAADAALAESTGTIPFDQLIEEMRDDVDALSDRPRSGSGTADSKTTGQRSRPAD